MECIIPEEVLIEAKELVKLYGPTLKFIGDFNGYKIYRFCFPEHKEIGFPVLYEYDSVEKIVLEISGFRALDIINKLEK